MRLVLSWKRFVLTIVFVFVAIVLLVVGGSLLLVRFMPFKRPQLAAIEQPTEVYDRFGKPYLTLSSQRMPNLTYAQIPKVLQNAIVSTEDHSFWTSSSIDVKGILRSAVVDMTTDSYAEGGSTIQEQLAKILYLTDKKTLIRKLKQVLLGVDLSRYYTKQEILAMYVNHVFMGENAVGMNAAAWRYFGINLAKDPKALTLDDAALLAGMLQAPSGYNPLLHPKAALARRNTVLENMVRYGGLSPKVAAKAAKQPIHASYHSLPGDPWTEHPLFTNFLFSYAAKQGISEAELLQGGLKIYTSINPTVQHAFHIVFWSTNYDHLWPGPTKGIVPEGGAVVLDPKTGGVLGAAGSRKQGFVRLGLDRVYSYSLPGSTIKPVMDYGPAIQTGKWGPTSILDDQPQNFDGDYDPQNWNYNAPHYATLQYGLEDSQNVASVWLLNAIGIKTGADFAMRDGIHLTTADQHHLSIAIGGIQHGVNPWQMARAYEPFDNGGVQMAPHLIDSIVNDRGQVIYQFQRSAKTIMSPSTARTMTSLLQDDVDYGIDGVIGVKGWGTAGKSGTQQYSSVGHSTWVSDGWFCGYLPNMVGAAYVGYDNSDAAHHLLWNATHVDPAWNAGMILHEVFKLSTEHMQPEHFAQGPFPESQGERLAAYHLPTPIAHPMAVWSSATNGVELSWTSKSTVPVDFVVTRKTLFSGTTSIAQNVPSSTSTGGVSSTTGASSTTSSNATGAGNGSTSSSGSASAASPSNGSAAQSGATVRLGKTAKTSFFNADVSENGAYVYTIQAVGPDTGFPIGPAVTVTYGESNIQPATTGPGTGAGATGTEPPGGPGQNPTSGGAGGTQSAPGATNPANGANGSGGSNGSTSTGAPASTPPNRGNGAPPSSPPATAGGAKGPGNAGTLQPSTT
ncbi:MAG: transglycosylase domain-containing protein [Alicyclobacillaceae bacterium]|nr:transglycosylase domain-containing protein [Alicyclobacillaceae bacterium]